MKYLSLLIFAVLACWTWNLIHSSVNAPEATPHETIQIKMREFIEQKVKTDKPTVTDFQLHSVWTETIEKNQVKVHYSYSFKNPATESETATRQSHQGTAILKQADNNVNNWNIEKQSGTTDSIEFSEALVISPNDKAEEAPPAATEVTPATTPAPTAPTEKSTH